jgi:PAS domain S-box-containing protein
MITWPLPTWSAAVDEDGSAMRREDFPQVKALRTGQVVRHAVFGLPHGRTGELRWLRVTAFPDAWHEQGRPRRAYSIFADVTEQHRAEARLREANRLLGRLRDANVVGVAAGTEEVVQEANDAFIDIVGYNREDVESGRISWETITPAEWVASDADALDQLRLTGVCRPYEKEYLRRDGHRVPDLIGAAVLDRDPLRGVEFVVDLTARQRREQERADLVAREQAARKEADTARARLAFLLQAGELVEPTGDQADLLEQINKLVEVAVTGEEDRFTAGRDVPDTRRAHQALRAINSELEKRVSQRTSDLVRAESERRALETQLQQAHRLQTVGQLTSSIAHDFSNLLAIIVGYTEMAEDVTDDRDPELHRILKDIRGAADRAVHLSGDLLSFSRRTRAKTEDVDLNTLISRMMDLLIMSMSGRAEVIFEPSPILPSVRADRGQLEQVLLNLAVNARDAMPAGGTLTIRTSTADFSADSSRLHPGTKPGRYVELAFQDTGVGMSTDVRDRIFERFFTTKPGTGTGLGLSTVHGIITDAGATIEVDSLEGRGSTFRVYLPAAPG